MKNTIKMFYLAIRSIIAYKLAAFFFNRSKRPYDWPCCIGIIFFDSVESKYDRLKLLRKNRKLLLVIALFSLSYSVEAQNKKADWVKLRPEVIHGNPSRSKTLKPYNAPDQKKVKVLILGEGPDAPRIKYPLDHTTHDVKEMQENLKRRNGPAPFWGLQYLSPIDPRSDSFQKPSGIEIQQSDRTWRGTIGYSELERFKIAPDDKVIDTTKLPTAKQITSNRVLWTSKDYSMHHGSRLLELGQRGSYKCVAWDGTYRFKLHTSRELTGAELSTLRKSRGIEQAIRQSRYTYLIDVGEMFPKESSLRNALDLIYPDKPE